MIKIILLFLCSATASLAVTNYVMYSTTSPNVVGSGDSYRLHENGAVTAGRVCLYEPNWKFIRVAAYPGPLPKPFKKLTQIDTNLFVEVLPGTAVAEAAAKAARGTQLKESARTNILAIADANGVLDRPVSWPTLLAVISIKANDPDPAVAAQAIATGSQLQAYYLLWKENGGDPWNVQ